LTVKKKTRTNIGKIPAAGFELSNTALAKAVGGRLSTTTCDGDTPHETSTATLNTKGRSDTQTDCSSRPSLMI
jgi:hypothetical protein